MNRFVTVLWGFGGTVLAIALTTVLLLAWWTYNRAWDGEQAWQCLHQPACLQGALSTLSPVSAAHPDPPRSDPQKPAKH